MENPPLKILRIVDANLNRCREGLRVLEDTARFLWNEEKRFLEFRKFRHQVDALTRDWYKFLVESRSSLDDAGRTIKEEKRADTDAIVFANFRRCEVSLRVLEEYGKIFSSTWSQNFKAIRFALYTLEKKTVQKIYEKR